MPFDGELRFDTSIDQSGFKSGIEKLGSIASSGMKLAAGAISAASDAIKSFGTYAIDVGSNFESSMSQVCATMGVTKDTVFEDGVKPFEVLEKAAIDAGSSTQYSATEAGEALNYLALAGYSAAQAADALPSILNLAAAGGMDLAYASDLATDAMGALGIVANNQNLTEFGDKMAKAAQKSNTSVSQLGEAILTVGGTAKQLAGGTTELNTALGVLANVGIKGSEGGTALRNIMLAMTPTTDKATNAFKRLGLESYDADGNLRPLNETFKDLNAAMSDMNSQEKTETLNAIFNKVDLKSASAMLAACASSTDDLGTAFLYAGVPADKLNTFMDNFNSSLYNTMTEEEFVTSVMNDFGVSAEEAGAIYSAFATQLNGISFEKLYNEIDNCDGAMEDMAHTMNDNLQGDMKSLESKCETLGIAVYNGIQEPLRELAGKGIEYVQQLTEAFESGGFEGLVAEIGTVLSDAVNYIASKLPDIVRAASSVITSFIQGIADSSSGIASVIPEIIETIAYSISSNTESVVTAGVSIIMSLVNGVASSLPFLLEAADEIIYGISNALKNSLPALIEAGKLLINNLITGFCENIGSFVESAVEIICTLADTLIENLPMLITAAIDMVMVLSDAIFDNLDKLIDCAIEIIMAIVNGLLNNIDKLIQAAAKIITAIVNAITRNISKLTKAVIDIVMAVVQALLDNLPVLLEAVFEIISAVAVCLVQSIPEILELVPKLLESLIQAFKNTNWGLLGLNILLGIGQGVRSGLSDAASWFDGLWSGIDSVFTEKIPELIDNAAEWFKQLPGKVATELTNVITHVVQWGNDITKQASDAASEFVNNVVTFFKELPGKIAAELAAIVTNIIQWASDIAQRASDAASTFIINVIEFIRQLPGKVKDKLQEVIEKVLSWASEMKTEALKAASTFVSEIINKVSSLPSDIYNKIKDAISKVKEWGAELAAKGKEAAQNLFDNIVNTITGLPDKLRDIGSNIVEGLWNGINDMAGWISEKISGFGEGILNGLKGFFGIHSPSRLMEDVIGKNLALGVGVGIENTMPVVTADAVTAFDDLIGAVGAISYATPNTYSNVVNSSTLNTNSTVNNMSETRNENVFYINGAQDPQKTAEQISEELAALERRERAGKGR